MLLALIVAMIVYFFWFVKTEFQRVIERIDQSAIGIARLNRELAQSSVKALTDQLSMHDYNETYSEVEEGEEEGSIAGVLVAALSLIILLLLVTLVFAGIQLKERGYFGDDEFYDDIEEVVDSMTVEGEGDHPSG